MPRLAPRTGDSQDTASMAERIRLVDWRLTSLGALSDWPPPLRVTADLMLSCCRPMCLSWGDEQITIYNDAYRPILEGKPDALGRPFPDVWADAWPLLGPVV